MNGMLGRLLVGEGAVEGRSDKEGRGRDVLEDDLRLVMRSGFISGDADCC